MTQFPHDQFAKDLLETLLSPFGEVQTAKTIDSQVREIDVYFNPNPNTPPLANLGLLHKLAATPATFEPFRKAVTVGEICSCIAKLFDLHGELARQAKRDEKSKLTAALKIILENKQNRNTEETELIMNLSPLYLEQIDLATQKGRAVGEATGIATGLERGRLEEGRSLIIRQLTRKLGELNPETIEQIDRLNLDEIESLGDALLDFDRMEDLFAYLQSS
jgi:Domain of unknown function (DUF4351)